MSAAQALPKLKKITLQVATGPTKGEVFHLAKAVVKIGRGPENDIVLDKDTKISRTHIELHQVHGMVQLHNVTDKNTMLVNGRLMKSALLDGNTAVVIGDTQLNFLFHIATPAPRGPSAGMPMPPQQQKPQAMQTQQQFQAQQMHYQQQQGLSGAASQPTSKPISAALKNGKSPKLMIYAALGVLIAVGAYMYSPTATKNARKTIGLKTTEEYQGEVETSTKTTESRNKELEKMGEHTIQYDMAQQQYIKGFRDFHHQQYGRAIISLRTALSYYPQHELARRYLTLAQKKQDEAVQAHLDSGAKYRGEGNYRMCVASYSKVIRTLEDQTDKNYKAAEQFIKECEAQQKERY